MHNSPFPGASWPYVRLIAHRGAGKIAPENTLTAMRVGHAHGYRMVEFDVKLSADGVAFLLHDATLDRTTTGQGRADSFTWRALSRLDAPTTPASSLRSRPEKDMNLLAKIGLLGLMASGTATVLYADPMGGWLSPNGVGGGTTTGATQNGQVGVGVGVTMTLSQAEIGVRVRTLHEQTRADARHIQHLQQIARKQKDVIKLNCVNDKLVQVKPEMNIVEAKQQELETAGDAERMAVFETIAQAADSLRRLREESDQCIGEPITFSGGESSNSFTGPAAPDDPTKGFGNHPIEPPAYASPFN